MYIKLKSIATNVNYDTDKLKEYYKILTEAGYKVKVFDDFYFTKIKPEQINDNSYLEIKIKNDFNAILKLGDLLGRDLIFRAEKSIKDYCDFLVCDDYDYFHDL